MFSSKLRIEEVGLSLCHTGLYLPISSNALRRAGVCFPARAVATRLSDGICEHYLCQLILAFVCCLGLY